MRRFLQGLGAGILLAALVMGISYRSDGAKVTNGDEIIEKAKELGMVFPKGSEAPKEVEKKEASSGSATSAGNLGANGAGVGADTSKKTAPTDKPKSTKKPKDSKASESASATPTTNPSTLKKGQKVMFTVEEGLLSSSVAREMKKAGIIADDKAFDRYLVDKGLGKMVRSGKYEMKVGDSYEKLAKIITHTK
ncbi:MAG: hypothetical protein K5639_05550 [Eubacterium sp.]|nr:hypothetical protein [Eubacterium sp.]